MVGSIIRRFLLLTVTICNAKTTLQPKALKATAVTKNRGGGDAPSPFGFVWGDPVHGESMDPNETTTIPSPTGTAKQSPSLSKRAFIDDNKETKKDDEQSENEKHVDDREERHPPNGIFQHRYRSESQSHREHKHNHHHHDKKRRGSNSHHQHKCGCEQKHEHHECHKECKVESLKRCTMELSGLTLIKTSVPYCQAEEVCRTFGMYLAEVTVPACCEIAYPVLCQRQPNKDALQTQQEEKSRHSICDQKVETVMQAKSPAQNQQESSWSSIAAFGIAAFLLPWLVISSYATTRIWLYKRGKQRNAAVSGQ